MPKKCLECNKNKPYSGFNFRNRSKGIYKSYCRSCEKRQSINRRLAKKELVKTIKQWAQDNRIELFNFRKICVKCRKLKYLDEYKIRTDTAKFHSYCDECVKLLINKYEKTDEYKIYRKNYVKENIDKIRKNNRKWAKNNIDKIKQWRENNKEKVRDSRKKWEHNNREKINKTRREFLNNSPTAKVKHNLRKRFKRAINGKLSTKFMTDNVGCSADQLKLHLERKFYPNPKTGEQMTWENYGYYGWHIDHIIPLASEKDITKIAKLFHYTNLQPLWAEENFKKGSKKW